MKLRFGAARRRSTSSTWLSEIETRRVSCSSTSMRTRAASSWRSSGHVSMRSKTSLRVLTYHLRIIAYPGFSALRPWERRPAAITATLACFPAAGDRPCVRRAVRRSHRRAVRARQDRRAPRRRGASPRRRAKREGRRAVDGKTAKMHVSRYSQARALRRACAGLGSAGVGRLGLEDRQRASLRDCAACVRAREGEPPRPALILCRAGRTRYTS